MFAPSLDQSALQFFTRDVDKNREVEHVGKARPRLFIKQQIVAFDEDELHIGIDDRSACARDFQRCDRTAESRCSARAISIAAAALQSLRNRMSPARPCGCAIQAGRAHRRRSESHPSARRPPSLRETDRQALRRASIFRTRAGRRCRRQNVAIWPARLKMAAAMVASSDMRDRARLNVLLPAKLANLRLAPIGVGDLH